MRSLFLYLNEQVRKVNWMLLVFLLLFLNVKMAIKCVILVLFLIILQKKLRKIKLLQQKFTWFYFGMIAITLLNLLINISSHSTNYLVAAATGIGFWLMSIGAAAIIYMFVSTGDTAKVHSAISLFFILNAIFTIAQLVSFMWDAGTLNPYTYQGMNQKYFISTGDLLRGITFDVSTTNALLNSIGVLYFLDKRKVQWLLLCMVAMLLTASNFSNVLLLAVLFFLFIFQSDRSQKSVIVVCLFMLIVFLSKVSPQNKLYINYVWQKISDRKIDTILPERTAPLLTSFPDSILNNEDKKRKFAMLYLDSVNTTLLEKKSAEYPFSNNNTNKVNAERLAILTKPSIPKPNIHSEPYQRKQDTAELNKLTRYAILHIPAFDTSYENTHKKKLPGKLIALQQTRDFFRKHPLKIITGTGIGQFSSKLAFRATGLQLAGGYPAGFIYINKDFRDNHLKLHLDYFSKDTQVHSLMNTPDSVYDQLLAEYGIAGMLCFILFYTGYFIRKHKVKSYGLPLLLLMAGALAIGYWFEQLSIVIIFELLMLVNIKETKEQTAI